MFIYKEKIYNCSFELSLSMFGKKWYSLVLYHLSDGTKRYNELRKMTNGITQKMLTQTLRDLERFELIDRKIYPVIPPKVEYSLTDYGKEVLPILQQIQEFGEVMYTRYEKEGLIQDLAQT